MLNGDSNQPRPAQNQQYNPPQQQPLNYYPQVQQQNVAYQQYQQPKQEKVQSQAVPTQSNGAPAPTKKKKPQEPREIL